MSQAAVLRGVALGLLVLSIAVLTLVLGPPDVDAVRARVDAAGAWGPAIYVLVYVALALVPYPKALLTVTGGALFGLPAGAALALLAALVGAIISFGLGRLLGRAAVDRLIGGRLTRVDALLRDHGLAAVLVLRLAPVVPYIAINYAAGLSAVRLRHFVLGSGVGMVPGSLAYAALGAYGMDPWGLVAASTVLVLLLVGGAWWARRLGARRDAPGDVRV